VKDQTPRPLGLLLIGFGPALLAAAACHHDDAVTKTATAAIVVGPADTHCGAKVVTVDPAACKATPAADAGAGGADAGSGYPATMSNGEGDDDDCKYHIKWAAAGAATTTTKTLSLRPLHDEGSGGTGTGGDVSFTVTLTNKKDGSPVTAAPVNIESFLDETHPSLNAGQTTTETSPGTYTVGPVRFDVSGKWTIRFHIHDECNDSEESAHGHGAFFTQVVVQ
jgi:hypothetical protein